MKEKNHFSVYTSKDEGSNWPTRSKRKIVIKVILFMLTNEMRNYSNCLILPLDSMIKIKSYVMWRWWLNRALWCFIAFLQFIRFNYFADLNLLKSEDLIEKRHDFLVFFKVTKNDKNHQKRSIVVVTNSAYDWFKWRVVPYGLEDLDVGNWASSPYWNLKTSSSSLENNICLKIGSEFVRATMKAV